MSCSPIPSPMAVSGFQVDGQFVNFGSTDEIVFRQAADGVCPQFDRHVAILNQVQVWMMALGFGNFRHFFEEAHRCQKVGDDPRLANPLVIVREFPAVEMLDLICGFFGRKLWNAAFARDAFLTGQLIAGEDFHNQYFFFLYTA